MDPTDLGQKAIKKILLVTDLPDGDAKLLKTRVRQIFENCRVSIRYRDNRTAARLFRDKSDLLIVYADVVCSETASNTERNAPSAIRQARSWLDVRRDRFAIVVGRENVDELLLRHVGDSPSWPLGHPRMMKMAAGGGKLLERD